MPPQPGLPPLPDPLPPIQPQPVPFPPPAPRPPIDIPPVVELPEIPKPPLQFRALRGGCYLINYDPVGASTVCYDGTLRIQHHSNGVTASGDLYQRPLMFVANPLPAGILASIFRRPKGKMVLKSPPDPAGGIPIFSRAKYRYYLRVTQILELLTTGESFTLGFEMHRFTKSAGAWNTGGTWSNEGAYTAEMTWTPAPSGFPSSGDYLAGDVRNAAGVITGRLTMGWISEFLRRATIEIDKVSASETPLDNGAGVDWQDAFGEAGWQIDLDVSEANVSEPSGDSWSYAECHQGLLDHRDENNLDKEWRYYVLCIRNHDDPDACRGVMFDAYGHDANNIPREGCVVCSHWMIPNEAPWGTVKGQRYGATVVFFRTAVHEASHAMCLYHNWSDDGFMCTTDVIAENDPVNFPANIQWSFHPDDLKRLRHMPDIFVRPGGLPFGVNYPTFISPDDLAAGMEESFEFHVTPMLEAVPLGAPVRVDLDLRNISGQPMPAPASLSFKTGRVSGWVVDPGGTARSFSPILLYADHEPMTTLEPNQSLAHSLTLLRGGQGALFPAPGVYQVFVEVHWEQGGMEVNVQAGCQVLVTAAEDQAHAAVAYRLLTTPDAMLILVLGGDHLPEGIAAIQAALQNPVLRPHYAYVEARRLSERFRKRKPNPKAAAALIDGATVMNTSELKKAIILAQTGVPRGAAHDKLTRVLKQKSSTVMGLSVEVKNMLDAL